MKSLTPAQEHALRLDKNILVEASAGSGKTTILVQRYLKILKENPHLSTSNILAITYTKKAAYEMMSRLQALCGNTQSELDTAFKHKLLKSLGTATISTIHGFCYTILKSQFISLGYGPDTRIIEGDLADYLKNQAIQSAFQQLKHEKSPIYKALRLQFSLPSLVQMMGTCFSKQELLPETSSNILSAFGLCQTHYNALKKSRGGLDYDDLIKMTLSQLRHSARFRENLQSQYQFILLDECQDANEPLWELITLILGENDPFASKKLFMVGDRFQSIYAFRGTHPRLFGDICEKADPATTELINARDNFRCKAPLVQFLNPLFTALFHQHMAGTKFPTLIPHIAGDDTPYFELALLEEDPAPPMISQSHTIASWILKKQRTHPRPLGDYAILMRRKKDLDKIKSILNAHGLSAKVFSGTGLFQKPEIIDMVNIIKAIMNPGDDLSWVGVLKSPFFSVSDQGLYLLKKYDPNTPILSLLKRPLPKTLSPEDHAGLTHAKRCIPKWLKDSQLKPLHKWLYDCLDESGIWTLYYHRSDQAAANIHRFIRKIAGWEKRLYTEQTHVLSLLEHHIKKNNLEAEESLSENAQDAVQLMTVHAAKGLEFPVVILPELERKFNMGTSQPILINRDLGIGLSSQTDSEEIEKRKAIVDQEKTLITEEEIRLFYVACTRAKDTLFCLAHEKGNGPSIYTMLAQYIKKTDSGVEFTLGKQRFSFPLVPKHTEPPKKLSPPSTPAIHYAPLTQKPSLARNFQVEELITLIPDSIFTLPEHCSEESAPSDPKLGTLIHKLLTYASLKPNCARDYLDSILSKESMIDRATLEDALTLYLDAPFFKDIRKADAIYTEHPITVTLKDKLITVRLDLLVKHKSHWQIIDFKTSDRPNHAHFKQLALYALILSNTLARETPITSMLYYTPSGKINHLDITSSFLEKINNHL